MVRLSFDRYGDGMACFDDDLLAWSAHGLEHAVRCAVDPVDSHVHPLDRRDAASWTDTAIWSPNRAGTAPDARGGRRLSGRDQGAGVCQSYAAGNTELVYNGVAR